MKSKWVLRLINLALFVFAAAFVVLHVEFDDGNFLYYFFKAKVYYAIFNKIIFPVGFWGCFALFYAIYYLSSKRDESHREPLLHSLRYALFYHLYLLLLTHSNEVVSGFYDSPPLFILYEKLFIPVAFVGYYLAGINVIHKVIKSGCRLWQLILPVSAIIPYLYLPSPFIHIFYLTISLGLYGTWQFLNREKWGILLGNLISNDRFKIGIIGFVSLAFRLWYAYPYATLDLVGYSADGPVYFESALAFSKGNWGDVNYWHAPFYSLYLSLFLILFGESSAVVFYSQALIGSFTPILIFLIARKLRLQHTSFIAGLLVAVSHLCIHYSVVINRAAPLSIAIPLLVYSLLCLGKTFGPTKLLLLGILFGATFYLGQETLPVLALFAIYMVRHLWKAGLPYKKSIYNSSLLGLGAISVFFSLNGIYHSHTDKWLPLGRASDPTQTSSPWNYNNNPYANEMADMGFNPIKSLGKSSEVFLDSPIKITRLLFEKLFSEIPDFLFDPGGTQLMPLHLAFETFYSANLQFYIYFFILVGFGVFVSNKSVEKKNKLLILGPILAQIIFFSFLWGTFRFRVPITPFNMILMASAVACFLFRGKILKDGPWHFVKLKIPLPLKSAGQLRSNYLALCGTIVFLSFWVIYGKLFSSFPKTHPQYELTPWTTIKSNELFYTTVLGLNRTVFSYYNKVQSKNNNQDMEIRFKMCRALMPGIKPYYQLAVDGSLIGEPKKMFSGCIGVEERLRLHYDTGMISLFVFVSRDGTIGELEPGFFSVNLEDNKKGTVKMPIASPISLDRELTQYVEQFKIYATNIKIDKPALFLLPKMTP